MQVPEGWRVQSKTVARSKPKSTVKKEPSVGERVLINQLTAMKIEFTTEFKFHSQRKWRADFRIDNYPILIEVEGGSWSGGRHTRGLGFKADCEKYSHAAIDGWLVIRATTEQVKQGHCLIWIEECIRNIDMKISKINY